jgi:hypothetical protein
VTILSGLRRALHFLGAGVVAPGVAGFFFAGVPVGFVPVVLPVPVVDESVVPVEGEPVLPVPVLPVLGLLPVVLPEPEPIEGSEPMPEPLPVLGVVMLGDGVLGVEGVAGVVTVAGSFTVPDVVSGALAG